MANTTERWLDPALVSATLQREHLNGQPTRLGELFIVRPGTGGEVIQAISDLSTHSSDGK